MRRGSNKVDEEKHSSIFSVPEGFESSSFNNTLVGTSTEN